MVSELDKSMSLSALKEEATSFVAKVKRHNDVPEMTKQSFQDALDKLLSDGSITAWNLVARLPFSVSSTCVECVQLKLKLGDMQKQLNDYKEMEKAAVRRQIAINIEFEMKRMAIERIPKLAPLLEGDSEDMERKISRMDLKELMDELTQEEQQTICNKFKQPSFQTMRSVLYDMKKFNHSAHPTTLFGKPITYHLAKKIAASTERRTRRFPQELPKIEQTQIYAEAAVLGLYEIRQKQEGWEEGQSLLYSCE